MEEGFADKKAEAQSTWGASPAGWTFGEGAEPGTKEFFDNVLQKRSTYEQPWLFQLVPFGEFKGKRVLELGFGAGYDAYEFCRNGADYSGIDITPENVDRARKHLGFYGYAPELMQGDAENLPFEDATFDIVFSNGVLHHTPDMEKAFREARRVLKPGGQFWVIVYHRDSVFYMLQVVLYGHLLKGGFRRESLADRRSRIEYSTSDAKPLVNVYSRRQVRRILRRSGFWVSKTWVRKLTVDDFPLVRGVGFVVRRTPQHVLDRLGRAFGWYVIAFSEKP